MVQLHFTWTNVVTLSIECKAFNGVWTFPGLRFVPEHDIVYNSRITQYGWQRSSQDLVQALKIDIVSFSAVSFVCAPHCVHSSSSVFLLSPALFLSTPHPFTPTLPHLQHKAVVKTFAIQLARRSPSLTSFSRFRPPGERNHVIKNVVLPDTQVLTQVPSSFAFEKKKKRRKQGRW